MKRVIAAALRCSLIFLVPAVTYAISAQWDLDPISGDWNTAANWTPNGVPNGPSDIARFGLSNTSDVSISANTEVNSIVFTPAATNPYAITASPGLRLTISGVGIVNNSGLTQNFATVASGQIRFTNNATAESNVSISNEGGTTNLFNHSRVAGSRAIFNEAGGTTNLFDHSYGDVSNEAGGTTNFFDHSVGSANNMGGGTTNFFDRSGGLSIFNAAGGTTNFFDHSVGTASNVGGGTTNFFDRSTGASIVNQGGTTNFSDHSTAGASILNEGDFSTTNFFDHSTAANASISNESGGSTNFYNSSTSGDASISNEKGGTTNFFDRSTGSTSNSDGGTTNFFDRSMGGASNSNGGTTNFFDRSTATSINNDEGSTNFFDHSNAGTAVITHSDGATNFFNRSSAGNADIETFTGGLGGFISFNDNSTAGNAFIGVTDNSFLWFVGNATAGHATIGSAGAIFFLGATAGNATISSFGYLDFEYNSRGGTAQIELGSIVDLNYIGILDISSHLAPGLTVGSLAGDENTSVTLGGNNLAIGSNNLSTTFSGVISDGGFAAGGVGGSLTKIGSGTLILTGANTYTDDTNINRGVLQVDGSIASNTFVNHRGTLAGTGTISGNVTNNGRVSPGSAASPGMLTVTANYTQAQYATLMIQLAGASAGQFSVLNVLGTANLNGNVAPILLNGFVPEVGESFTFLNYASLTGEFSQILDQVFNHGTEQWSVVYQNNNAVLTVEAHTPGVPDQGSTLLLLTLGLLGLVTFRKQLVHKQS